MPGHTDMCIHRRTNYEYCLSSHSRRYDGPGGARDWRRPRSQAHGEYRTKRVILDLYDAIQQAMATDTRITRDSAHSLHTAGHRQESHWKR